MAQSKLTKALHTDITKLKLCNKPTAEVQFLLDKSPFDDDDDDGMSGDVSPKEHLIIGRILPKSDIFKEGAYKIEMKLPSDFPQNPPLVRFLTPIYHPNVNLNGEFCHDLLLKNSQWRPDKSLIDVVKAVVERIDNPDLDYAFSPDLGKEYVEQRSEFNRKAAEHVRKHALPRE